jgi:hypothetical protein
MPTEIADVAEVIYYVEDSVAPLTVFKPPAFAPGDLLVLVISQDATNALADLTGPPGWADKGNHSQAPCQARVWSHMYNAADPSTWDFGYNAGADIAAALIRITGAESTPTIAVTSDGTGPVGGTATSPSVTPGGNGDLLLCTLDVVCGGTALGETDPTGMNNLGQGQVTGNFMAIAVASKQLTDSSPTAAQTWTAINPGTRSGGTFAIAIKSSGAFDPDPPLIPPGPELPPWLLDELLTAADTPFRGNNGVPLVKERLSGGASGASVTLTTGAQTDATDLLVLFHGNNFYAASQMVAPTGTAGTWTLRATGDNGSNSAHMKVWTRPAAAGANTVTFAPAVDEEHIGQLYVISGTDLAGGPVDVAAGSNGASSTTQVAPSIDPATFNCLLISAVQTTVNTTYTSASPPLILKSEFDLAPFIAAASAIQVLGDDQPTGTRTFTAAAAGTWASASIALTPLAVAAGGTATPVVVACVATIPAPAVATGSSATPAVVAALATIPTPAVGAPAVPVVVACTATIPAPTVSTGTNATPAVVSATATIPAPTVTTGQTATPSVVAGTTTIPAPTVTVGATATPSVVAGVASIPTPSVSAGGSATAAPTVVSATASIPAPSISTGQVATPAVVAAVATVPTPALHTGTTAIPVVVACTVTIPAPTVTTGAKATPSVVAAVAAIPTPTVFTLVTATPSCVQLVATIPAPVVRVSTVVGAVTVVGLASIPAPSGVGPPPEPWTAAMFDSSATVTGQREPGDGRVVGTEPGGTSITGTG